MQQTKRWHIESTGLPKPTKFGLHDVDIRDANPSIRFVGPAVYVASWYGVLSRVHPVVKEDMVFVKGEWDKVLAKEEVFTKSGNREYSRYIIDEEGKLVAHWLYPLGSYHKTRQLMGLHYLVYISRHDGVREVIEHESHIKRVAFNQTTQPPPPSSQTPTLKTSSIFNPQFILKGAPSTPIIIMRTRIFLNPHHHISCMSTPYCKTKKNAKAFRTHLFTQLS